MAKDPKQELKDARAALAKQQKGKKHEDAEYHRLNARVAAAERNVSWWRR